MIFVNKGIEIGTQALTLEIIADACGKEIAKAATFIVSLLFGSPALPTNTWYSQVLRLRKKVSNRPFFSAVISMTVLGSIVVLRQPTSVSVASFSEKHAEAASHVFHQPWFRWYALFHRGDSNCL